MTTTAFPVGTTTSQKLWRGFVGKEAVRGLFGFGVVTIALAQAVASLTSIHFNMAWQLAFGVAGGVLGACIAAISSVGSHDRG